MLLERNVKVARWIATERLQLSNTWWSHVVLLRLQTLAEAVKRQVSFDEIAQQNRLFDEINQ